MFVVMGKMLEVIKQVLQLATYTGVSVTFRKTTIAKELLVCGTLCETEGGVVKLSRASRGTRGDLCTTGARSDGVSSADFSEAVFVVAGVSVELAPGLSFSIAAEGEVGLGDVCLGIRSRGTGECEDGVFLATGDELRSGTGLCVRGGVVVRLWGVVGGVAARA